MTTDTDPKPHPWTGTADLAELHAAIDLARNCGDVDSLISLFHLEATMRMTDGNVVGGAEALRPALGNLVSGRPNLHSAVRQSIVSGDVAPLIVDCAIRVPVPASATWSTVGPQRRWRSASPPTSDSCESPTRLARVRSALE